MRLYHWKYVECLKQYSGGHIIVTAETAEAAREHVLVNVEDLHRRQFDYRYHADGTPDDDYFEDFEAWAIQLALDLNEEPELVVDRVILINGSE